MIHAIPYGWFSWSYRLLDDVGDLLVRLDQSAFRERATFAFDGENYLARRAGGMGGKFWLEDGAGLHLATAYKPSVFRRRFEVTIGDEVFSLEAAGWFSRSLILLRDGEIVGHIRVDSIFSRRAEVAFPDHLDRPRQFFLFWLAVVLWRRGAATAAAGS